MVLKKSLFLPSVLIWRKTRKRKPWTLSFIEEAWICRTGAIFQRFSVKRRQAQSDREVRVTLERRSEKKNTCAPQNRRSFLRFSDKQRQVGSEHEEWVTHGRRSTLYPHELFKLFLPQTPAETTANMVLCRSNIFSKEMTVTNKHMLLCYIWT